VLRDTIDSGICQEQDIGLLLPALSDSLSDQPVLPQPDQGDTAGSEKSWETPRPAAGDSTRSESGREIPQLVLGDGKEQQENEMPSSVREVKHETCILALDSGESMEIENGTGAKRKCAENECGLPQIVGEVCAMPENPVVERAVSMGEPPVLLPETEMKISKVEKFREIPTISETIVPPENDFQSPPKLEPETDVFVRVLPAQDADLFDEGSPTSDDCVMLGVRPVTPRVSVSPLTFTERPPTLEIEANDTTSGSKSKNVPLRMEESSVIDSSDVLATSSPKSDTESIELVGESPKICVRVSETSEKQGVVEATVKKPGPDILSSENISGETSRKMPEVEDYETLSVELFAEAESPRSAVGAVEEVKVTETSEKIGGMNSEFTDNEQKTLPKIPEEMKREGRTSRNIFDTIVSSCDLKMATDLKDVSVHCNVMSVETKEPVAVSSGASAKLTGLISPCRSPVAMSTVSGESGSSGLVSLPTTGGAVKDTSLPSISKHADNPEPVRLEISEDEDDNSSFELEMGEVVSVRSKQPAVVPTFNRSSSLLENIIDCVGIDKLISGSGIQMLGHVLSDSVISVGDPMLGSSSVVRDEQKSLRPKNILDPQFEISDDSSVELSGNENYEMDDLKLGIVPMEEVLKLNQREADKSGEKLKSKTIGISVVSESAQFKGLTTGGTTDVRTQSKDLSIEDSVALPKTVTKHNTELTDVQCINAAVPSVLDNLTLSEAPPEPPKLPQYGNLIPTVVDD
jgi:hypothetical protein